MYKVGDPIDGYCYKCKRNAFMSVAATDGRELFATVCRTCHTQQDYKPEISAEEAREQAAKKLLRMTTRRKKVTTGRGPEVVSRSRRIEEARLVEDAVLSGDLSSRKMDTSPPRRQSDLMEAQAPTRRRSEMAADALSADVAAKSAAAASPQAAAAPVDSITDLWRERTAALGPRDGKVYYADRIYDIGDVLLHKRYGMGIVESIVSENAAMVLFRDARQVIEMGQDAR